MTNRVNVSIEQAVQNKLLFKEVKNRCVELSNYLEKISTLKKTIKISVWETSAVIIWKDP